MAVFALEGSAWPVGACVVMSVLLGSIKNDSRQRQLRELVHEYEQTYGESAPNKPVRTTSLGAAAGALTGNSMAGGALGAIVDVLRHAHATRNMGQRQREMYHRINGMRAWTPWHGTYLLSVCLGLSWAAAWVANVK